MMRRYRLDRLPPRERPRFLVYDEPVVFDDFSLPDSCYPTTPDSISLLRTPPRDFSFDREALREMLERVAQVPLRDYPRVDNEITNQIHDRLLLTGTPLVLAEAPGVSEMAPVPGKSRRAPTDDAIVLGLDIPQFRPSLRPASATLPSVILAWPDGDVDSVLDERTVGFDIEALRTVMDEVMTAPVGTPEDPEGSTVPVALTGGVLDTMLRGFLLDGDGAQ